MRLLDVRSILEQREGQQLLQQIMVFWGLLGPMAFLEACQGSKGLDPSNLMSEIPDPAVSQ